MKKTEFLLIGIAIVFISGCLSKNKNQPQKDEKTERIIDSVKYLHLLRLFDLSENLEVTGLIGGWLVDTSKEIYKTSFERSFNDFSKGIIDSIKVIEKKIPPDTNWSVEIKIPDDYSFLILPSDSSKKIIARLMTPPLDSSSDVGFGLFSETEYVERQVVKMEGSYTFQKVLFEEDTTPHISLRVKVWGFREYKNRVIQFRSEEKDSVLVRVYMIRRGLVQVRPSKTGKL